MMWATLGAVVLSPAAATADEAAANKSTMEVVSSFVGQGYFSEAIEMSAKLNGCEFGLQASADPTTFAYLTSLATANRETQQPERAARCVVAAAAHAESHAERAEVMYQSARLLENPNRTTLAMLAGNDRFYDPSAPVERYDEGPLDLIRRPMPYMEPRLPDTEAERLAVLPEHLTQLRIKVLTESFWTFPTYPVAQELLQLGVSRDALREVVFNVAFVEPHVVVATFQEASIWMSALSGKPPGKCPNNDPYRGCGTREIVSYQANGKATVMKRTSPGFQLAAVVDRVTNEDESWAAAQRFVLYTSPRGIHVLPLPKQWRVCLLKSESSEPCHETTALLPVPSTSTFAGVHGEGRGTAPQQDRFVCTADGGPMCIVSVQKCEVCAFPRLNFDAEGQLVMNDMTGLDETVWGALGEYLTGSVRQIDAQHGTVAGAVLRNYGL